MRVFALALPVLASGCASVLGLGDPAPAPTCAVAGVDVCAVEAPVGPVRFAVDRTLNTATDCNLVVFDPNGAALCVIYATDLEIAGALRATGARPLVLAATGTIRVTGSLDVSSTRGLQGAGAGTGPCPTPTPDVAGAGAGGSFAGRGGDGGAGADPVALPGRRAADPVLRPIPIRGGCPAQGGFASGIAGGAVALAAGRAITVEAGAWIAAGGAGGRAQGSMGGTTSAGGGSGGYVALAAPLVTVRGTLAANGGGGAASGGGAGGGDGADATPDATPAPGGMPGIMGGAAGGAGAAGAGLDGAPGAAAPTGTTPLAGGAGGGAAGYVLVTGDTVDAEGAIVSPPAGP